MVTFDDWQTALGREFVNIGARASHYPSDARALIKWVAPLRTWVKQNRQPVKARLTAEELRELAQPNPLI
jgi:hypothetical protein